MHVTKIVESSNPWIMIHAGCPITFHVHGSSDAHVLLGDLSGDSHEFNIEAQALRELLRLGAEAIREMDAIDARERAESG